VIGIHWQQVERANQSHRHDINLRFIARNKAPVKMA
jgi:hypothetical protein